MTVREAIDTLIKGWYVVTMNPTRDIIRHGAVAIRGSEIVAVGKASDLEVAYEAAETVGGDRFVITPGLVNTHIHITVADVVLHDTDRPEWRPLLNVMNQLVWSADGRGVHTVFVDGAKVVEAGRMTTIDEDTFYDRCQQAGEAITARSGLPDKAKFPVW